MGVLICTSDPQRLYRSASAEAGQAPGKCWKMLEGFCGLERLGAPGGGEGGLETISNGLDCRRLHVDGVEGFVAVDNCIW